MKNASLIYRLSTILLIALLCTVLYGTSLAESTGTIWLVKPEKPTGWVNLRTEPSLESEGLARATLDQEVIVVDVVGEWVQVIFDGKEGYMKTEFLQMTDATAQALPPASTPQSGYDMKLYTDAPNEKCTVNIQYPHFNGADSLNAMVLRKVQKMIDETAYHYGSSGFLLEHQAAVTLFNDKMASIVFWGTFEAEPDRKTYTELHSLNIDLSTMREIVITDLYTVNADFVSTFFQKAYFPSAPITSYSKPLFPQMLSEQLSSDFSMAFSYPEDMHCFLKPDGIVFSMSATHASGSDHFEAQLNYADIQDFYLLQKSYWMK